MTSCYNPGNYEKGKQINWLETGDEALFFHAGTKKSDHGKILTNGGRVMAVTGQGKDIKEARERAYKAIKNVSWDGMQFRKDIGMDLLSLR